MNKKTKVAIIGLGHWGPNLLRNFIETEGVEVKYACDINEEALDKVKDNYSNQNISLTKDFNEVINDNDIEAVVIATPANTHYKLVKQSLESGKHVLAEKPIAFTIEECQELIDTAKQKELILMVDHIFLFNSAVKKIKELVKNKELGEVVYFHAQRLNSGLFRKDVNVIWDLAPHDISIMNYIMEDAKPVSVLAFGDGHAEKNEVKDISQFNLKFSNGVTGYVYVSWLSPFNDRKILIGGSKRMLLYDDMEDSKKIKIYEKGVDDLGFTKSQESDFYFPEVEKKEPLRTEVNHFLNCIKEKKEPLVNGDSGLKVVKILQASQKSLEEAKEIKITN